jgi:hypothetical protein
MNVKRSYTGLGNGDSEGFTTILVYPRDKNSFIYFHTDTIGKSTISYEITGTGLNLFVEGTKFAHLLRIHSTKIPETIKFDGRLLDKGVHWNYDGHNHKLFIKNYGEYGQGKYEIKF